MTSQLATRCNACGTAFRVVRDQLKVSEGWVRCGRCETVFNALEQLVDLRRDPLAPALAGGESPSHASLPELPAADAPRPPMADAFSALLRARTAGDHGADPPADTGDADRPMPAAPAVFPATSQAQATRASRAADQADTGLHAAAAASSQVDLLLDVPGDDLRPAFHDHPGDDLAPGNRAVDPGNRPLVDDAADARIDDNADDDTDDDAAATPEFVRAAERDARWRQPPVRWALTAAAALLAAALALQAAHHFRDGLAARWPQARPLLAGWCGLLGCRLEPLRRIADVTVENTALVPSGGLPGNFQLSVTLRNRGPLAVALPAVDLSLTDSNGQLVSRRALLAADLTVADAPPAASAAALAPAASSAGAVRAVLPANTVTTRPPVAAATRDALLRPDTDTRLQAVLVTESRVVGYTVELFYP